MARADEGREKLRAASARLLDWYARNRRDLPWRRSTDPYAIWVSEIMLQQTRVAVVVERYREFMGRFPTLVALGAGAGAGCAGDVERAGLLPAGAHAAQGGAVCERESWRQSAGEGGGAARSAGHWRLHGRGDSEHCARRAGGRGGWKCRAGTLPLCGLGSGKGRPHGAAAQSGGLGAQAAGPGAPGRFKPGNDGAGSNRLHAAESAMRGMPADDGLQDARRAQDAATRAR